MPLNINATPKRAPKQRPLIPTGQHMSRIVQIIDFGLQAQRPYKGQEKSPAYEVYVTFEYPNQTIEVDGEERPMWKSKRIKLSSDERSTCYKWYNKLDPDNVHRGDWSQLLGEECATLIVHNPGKGKNEGLTFDNIADVMPLMEGVSVPPLDNETVLFDLTCPELDTYLGLPDWMQGVIKENLEFDGSKLQALIEGNPTKWTARAPGDAPENVDSHDTVDDKAVDPADVDADEPWLDEDQPW